MELLPQKGKLQNQLVFRPHDPEEETNSENFWELNNFNFDPWASQVAKLNRPTGLAWGWLEFSTFRFAQSMPKSDFLLVLFGSNLDTILSKEVNHE